MPVEAFDPEIGFWHLAPAGDGWVERLAWRTDVIRSLSGKRTAHSLRPHPVVTVEFDFLASGDDAILADFLLTGWQSRPFDLPIWQDLQVAAGPIALGATELAIDTDGRGFEVGGLVAIWTDGRTRELVSVSEVLADRVTLESPTTRAWPAGALWAPVRRATLAAEVMAARFTGAAVYGRVSFELVKPRAWDAAEWPDAPAVDGLSLLSRSADWSVDPTISYGRVLRTFGGDTSARWWDDPSSRPWTERTERHTLVGRAEVDRFVRWACARRGRALPYLAPVRELALAVSAPVVSATASITVQARGFAELWEFLADRKYVALQHAGGWVVRRVTGVTLSGADEILALDAGPGVSLAVDEVLGCFWAEPCALASDAIELHWLDPTYAETQITREQVIP